jgi:hypothetical protein
VPPLFLKKNNSIVFMQLDLKLKIFKGLILSLAKYFQSANNVYKEFMNLLVQLQKLKEGVFIFY